MRRFTFLSTECLKSSECSVLTAHLNPMGHILNALWLIMWPVGPLGAAQSRAAERGLWHQHVAVAGTPRKGPPGQERIHRPGWSNRTPGTFPRYARVSELESPPRPSTNNFTFSRLETEAQDGVGTRPPGANLTVLQGSDAQPLASSTPARGPACGPR